MDYDYPSHIRNPSNRCVHINITTNHHPIWVYHSTFDRENHYIQLLRVVVTCHYSIINTIVLYSSMIILEWIYKDTITTSQFAEIHHRSIHHRSDRQSWLAHGAQKLGRRSNGVIRTGWISMELPEFFGCLLAQLDRKAQKTYRNCLSLPLETAQFLHQL